MFSLSNAFWREVSLRYESQRIVCRMACGFSALFTAYKAAEQLQTSINGEHGYMCLLILYICFTFSSVVAPWLVGKLGPRHLMWISGLPYVAIAASYVFPQSQEVLMGSCITVGMAAATLWSSEGSYMGICAQAMAKESGFQLTDCTSSLNGTFFAIFSVSGILSSLCVAVTMAVIPDSIRPLFAGLSAIGFMGVVILASLKDPRGRAVGRSLDANSLRCDSHTKREMEEGCVAMLERGPADANTGSLSECALHTTGPNQQPPPAGEGWQQHCDAAGASVPTADGDEEDEIASVGYMLRFLVRDTKILLLDVMMLVSGMRWGFFLGSFQASVVAPVMGLWFVPVTGVFIGSITSVASLVWKSLVLIPSFGRRSAIFITFVAQALWFLALAVWLHNRRGNDDEDAPNPRTPTHHAEGVEAAAGTIADGACLFGFCAVFAVLDPVWQGFFKATLQALYPGKRDLPCAMASFFTMSSIGIAIQQCVSMTERGVVWECAVQFAAILLATAAPVYLHYRVASLDPRD